MNLFLSLTCLFAVLSAAAACCLPDVFSFDFSVEMTSVSVYDSNAPKYHNMSFSGSVAVDRKQQKYYIAIPFFKQKALIDLSGKGPGKLVNADGKSIPGRDICLEMKVMGTIGDEWMCVLDNKRLFTAENGGRTYQMDLPKILKYVRVTVGKDSCLLNSGEALVQIDTGIYNENTTLTFSFENAMEKVVDRSVFTAPCTQGNGPRPGGPSSISLMSPEALIQMAGLGGGPSPQPEVTPVDEESLEGESDESDEEESDESDEEESDESSEEESAEPVGEASDEINNEESDEADGVQKRCALSFLC